LWLACLRFARAPVALSCRRGMRAEEVAPARLQLALIAATGVPEMRPPAATGQPLAGGAGSA